MELLHHGFAFGGDALYGHRAHWRQWGDPAFETPDNHDERTFMQASFYAALAGKVPWVPTERHRLIVTMYGGIGKNLDRFSTFRLPGRPTGYEWEALSRPLIPGVAFNELFPRKYAIANFTYRYEALFFFIRIFEGPGPRWNEPVSPEMVLFVIRLICCRLWEAESSVGLHGVHK